MGKLVLRLAIPSMLAQFVNVLYGIVDRIYVGNIPETGGAALAGAGVCGPVVTLISSFAILVGVGGAPLVAIRLGEKNQKGAQQILSNCFIMLFCMAIVLTAIVLALKGPMLMAFGASAATFPYADSYLTIYAMGSVFAVLSVGLNQFIVCQGFSTLGMATVLVGAVLNIILDPLFIFTFQMGIQGAALATVLSQAASFVFVMSVLCGKRVFVRITFGGYSWRIMRRILIFGFSPFIITATDSILIIALNGVLQHYGGPQDGDLYVTCATIVQSYMQLITMPLGGITTGTQPILSFNYGAKNLERIKDAFRKIVTLCVIFNVVMFLASQLIPQYFVVIFTRDKTLLDLAVWGIRTFTMGVIPLAFQYEFVDGLTALGIAKMAIPLSLNRKILFLILTFALPMVFGVSGAFYAEPIVDVACGIISSTVFALMINKLLRARGRMPDGQALYS